MKNEEQMENEEFRMKNEEHEKLAIADTAILNS